MRSNATRVCLAREPAHGHVGDHPLTQRVDRPTGTSSLHSSTPHVEGAEMFCPRSERPFQAQCLRPRLYLNTSTPAAPGVEKRSIR